MYLLLDNYIIRGVQTIVSREYRIDSNIKLVNILGEFNKNIKYLSALFNISITSSDSSLRLEGEESDVANVEIFFDKLSEILNPSFDFSFNKIDELYYFHKSNPELSFKELFTNFITLGKNRKKNIYPKNLTQKIYVESIKNNVVTFGIGPAGTGKTYLAIAVALSYFNSSKVGKVVLARPAVEAGEKLGFLPGNMIEKVNPYLRPLYDALDDMLGVDNVAKLMDKGFLEVAPLAFMRGRTLNDSFVILDEAQNTTSEQMKMFLTRLGFNSKAVVTGDVTQIDLPSNINSGLVEAANILKNIKGISFVNFTKDDVVRHKIVRDIIKAYESR